ncbi:MAG: hypothetical protein JW969_19615 [Spirochaetales bacterium]|nr:hypothetical protein [Spirochaetales bacterium]
MDILKREAGCQIGFFIPPDPANNYGDRIKAFQDNIIGRKAASVLTFFDWGDCKNQNFPTFYFNTIINNNSVPHMVWEPFPEDKTPSFNMVDDILQGKTDMYLSGFAREAGKFGHKFWLRPAHEMNGDWYGWCGAKNGANREAAEKYIAMYRKIVTVFREEQADNVSFVWAPFAKNLPDEEWNQFENYWPGEEYVDWIGIDGYNWYDIYPMETVDDLFKVSIDRLIKLCDKKPVMLAEFGSNKHDGRDAWIRETFQKLKTASQYEKVRAFFWFNIDKFENNHNLYWAIHETDTEDIAAMKESLDDPYYIDKGDTFR